MTGVQTCALPISAQSLAELQAAFDAYKADADTAYSAMADEFAAYRADVLSGADWQEAQQRLSDTQMELARQSIPTDQPGTGNHTSGMLSQVYRGDIIYSNLYDTGNIYKENTSGLGDRLLRNISSSEKDPLYNILGVYGDWLYYRHRGNIFRYNQAENSNYMLIHSYKQLPVSGIQAAGGNLYFLGLVTPGERADNLWSMEPDGAFLTRVKGVQAQSIASDGTYLYIATVSPQALIRLDPEDNSQTVLLANTDVNYLNYIADALYFTSGGQVMKLSLTGTEPVPVGGVYGAYLNGIGDWLYYVNTGDNDTVYRITTDGLYNEKLSDVEDAAYVNIAGGWVYFIKLKIPGDPSSLSKAYKMRLDGSDLMFSKP